MNKIIFDQLGKKTNAVWSLLLASGYLKVLETIPTENAAISVYRLVITNLEVKTMFEQMIKDWFEETPYFEDFVDALFKGGSIMDLYWDFWLTGLMGIYLNQTVRADTADTM